MEKWLQKITGNCFHNLSFLYHGICVKWHVVIEIFCCSVTKSCLTLWDPLGCSTPGFRVLHYLHQFAQTSVHWVDDAIQPLLSPSPILNLSQHQDLFQWISSLHQVTNAEALASVLPMNIQGCFPFGLTGMISLQSKGLSRVFSSTTVWNNQFFSTQSSLWYSSRISTWLLGKP